MGDHYRQVTPKDVLEANHRSFNNLIVELNRINARLDSGFSRLQGILERLENLETMFSRHGISINSADSASSVRNAAANSLSAAPEPLTASSAPSNRDANVTGESSSDQVCGSNANLGAVNSTSTTSTTQVRPSEAVPSVAPSSPDSYNNLPVYSPTLAPSLFGNRSNNTFPVVSATSTSSKGSSSSNGTSSATPRTSSKSRLLSLFPPVRNSLTSQVSSDQSASSSDTLVAPITAPAPSVVQNATAENIALPPTDYQVSMTSGSSASSSNVTSSQSSSATLSTTSSDQTRQFTGPRVPEEIIPKPNPKGTYAHCRPPLNPDSRFADGPPKNERRSGNRPRSVPFNNPNSQVRISIGNGGGRFDPADYTPFIPLHLRPSTSRQDTGEGSSTSTEAEELGSTSFGASHPPQTEGEKEAERKALEDDEF